MFIKVNVGYEDREGRDVCGGCGSYYVVSPREAEANQAMYEALGTIKRTAESSGDITYLQNALKIIARIARETKLKAEG